jgi:hypothetical protein
LAAVSAENAVLRMIAAESTIFVTWDIVLSPSFVCRRRCDGPPDEIDKRAGLFPGVPKVDASLSRLVSLVQPLEI